MGQLEKYGLYVLCLLIFLILGVTLWGSGEVTERENRARMGGNDLNAKSGNAKTGNAKSGNNAVDPGPGAGRSVVDPPVHAGGKAALPDFRALLQPKTPPKKDPAAGGSGDNPGSGESPKQVKPPATPPATDRPTHTIKSGDNFESIALQYFGDRLLRVEISRLNPKLDPRRLQLKQKVLLPSAADVEQFRSRHKRSGTTAVAGSNYKIARGDTLEGIAVRLLGSRKRTREIQQLNPGVDPTNLKIGSTLRLPKK